MDGRTFMCSSALYSVICLHVTTKYFYVHVYINYFLMIKACRMNKALVSIMLLQ